MIGKWDDLDTKGKNSGIVKISCPECYDTRKNKRDKPLYVNLNSGVAKCFNCDALFFRDSIKKDFIEQKYTLPPQTWRNHTKLSDKMVAYFSHQRKISQSTLVHFDISEESVYFPQSAKHRNAICFNYIEGDILVNKKYRSGNKEFTQSSGSKPLLYNINASIGQNELFITEGEIDVLSLYEIGIKNAVSIPNGANDNDNYWINSESYIKDISKFYIATDNDPKGNEVAEKIAQRLGRHRCERIRFIGKDANEDLVNGVLTQSIHNTERYPVSGTYDVIDLWDDMISLAELGVPPTLYPKGKWCENLSKNFSVMRGHLVTSTGIPSHGKALDVNTLIPTPSGFKKMIELNVGDKVFDENGKECSVVWKSEVWRDRPTYKLTFSDNSEIIADENHEWLTDTWKSRRSYFNSIKNGRVNSGNLKKRGVDQTHKKTFASVKTTKEISETLKTKNDNRNNHSVLLSKPIEIKSKKLLIDPYVLGCWLGDGTSKNGGFTSNDLDIVDGIRSRGYIVNSYSNKYGYGIIGLKVKLRDLGLLSNKHIPTDYLFSSKEQRLELLRGLMDTDGHCSIVEARNEYCGNNLTLVRNVYQLVCSLGIKATFVESDATLNGKVVSKKYRVFFKTNEKVFNLSRKQNIIDSYFETRSVRGNDLRYITKCELVYGHQTQCIEVDSESHLFLAGEQFIPTHNSEFTDWYVLNLSNDHNLKVSWYSPEHDPKALFMSNLATKVIGNYFDKSSNEVRLKFKMWAKERLYITSPDANEEPNWEWIMNKFQEQMYRYGIDIFVIDAFNKVVMNGRNEYQEIRKVLTKLTAFAQRNNVIIFLVAHPTKMRKNEQTGVYEMPDLYSVAGSADFRNQTHDGYCIYRYFDDHNPRTVFVNLKTKMKFQGNIGAMVDFKFNSDNHRFYDICTYPDNLPLWDSEPKEYQPIQHLFYDDDIGEDIF